MLRVGDLKDSDMVARRVATLDELTCAAPSYVDRFGLPLSFEALDGHRMVGFRSSATGGLLPLEFVIDRIRLTVTLPSPVSVNGAESLVVAARLGLGIIQAPRYPLESDLKRGALIQLLPHIAPSPTPVSLLYPRNRQLSAAFEFLSSGWFAPFPRLIISPT